MFHIVDEPNQRSSHKDVTLLGGGIIFFIATLIYYILSGFVFYWFFIGMSLITLISFADDIKPKSFLLRLFFQLLALLLLYYQLDIFDLSWYYVVLILISSVGVLNAYNFMDGINGMTGSYNLVVLGTLWYIDQYIVNFADESLIYILLMAVVIFLFFNFRTKARCFSGDVGALTLAFVVVFLLAQLVWQTQQFAYVGLLVIYGIDTGYTIIHRILLKRNIFTPHRKHLFQLMVNEAGLPHILVSSIYSTIQLIINIGLILLVEYVFWYLLSVIVILSVAYVFVKKKYFPLHWQSVVNRTNNLTNRK